MALIDNVERILYEDEQANLDIPAIRADRRHFECDDPFQTMSNCEFRLNFRLNKASVIELACLITP